MEKEENNCSPKESADPAATAEKGNIISHHCNVCGVECKFRCSKCHTAYYCSVEHQKQEWATHKVKCKRLRSATDDDEDSDFTFEYTGNIDDGWGQSVEFCYSKPLSKRDKKDIMGDDAKKSEKTVSRLQEEMYQDNKESLNTLQEWRCCRDPAPPLVRPSRCGGVKAKCVVMWMSPCHIALQPRHKRVICRIPIGLFPLCTECIRRNYDNDSLASTGKGLGLDVKHLWTKENGEWKRCKS